MQVYRLGPKSGDTSDRNWEATTLNNKCWVLAESEADARQKVALATGIGPRLQRGATIPKSPWINRELTDCVPDNAAERQPPRSSPPRSRRSQSLPRRRSPSAWVAPCPVHALAQQTGRRTDRSLNCLDVDVGQTPAQCCRDDQNHGDHAEVSGLLSSRRMLPHFSIHLELSLKLLRHNLQPMLLARPSAV